MSEAIYFTSMPSPVGPLTLTGEDAGLTSVRFAGDPEAHWVRDDRRLAAARAQLEEYFGGARTAFDLPLVMRGTPFQERVWRALCAIAYGATASYGEIAAAIGAPGAARAIGGANHRNPIAIIVPCHRVIGASGSLTGYGGGEPRKRWLLDHEAPQQRLPTPRPARRGGATSGSSRTW